MQTDVIRRISIQATLQGEAEVTAGLKNVSGAQDGIIASSEKLARSQLSVQAAYERQQRSLDISYRMTQQFEKAQRTLDQALQQGIVTSQRYAELSALNADKHSLLTKAANDNSNAIGLNQIQVLELGHVFKAAFEQAAAGAPILRVLAQQGASTAQALSLGSGGVGGTLKGLASSALAFLGPVGLVAAGFLAAAAAATGLYEYLKKEGPTSEKLMTEHDRLLGIIKNSYDAVTGAASRWYQVSKSATQVQLLQQEIELQKKLQEEVGKGIQKTTQANDLGGTSLFGLFGARGSLSVKDEFGPFEDAIIRLQQGFKAGTPDVREFVDEVGRITLLSPSILKTGNQLISLVGDASKFDLALKQIAATKRLMAGDRLSEGDRGILGLPDPPKSQADPFQNQINSISKHTATVIADTQAVGASVGEHARLRAEAQLLEVATRNGATASEDQKNKIAELGAAAGAAAQAFAQKNAQSQADFALQTVFLSDTEKQIAAVNFQLHGNAWKDFMNDGLSSTMRITDELKTMSDGLKDVGKAAFSAALQGKLGMDGLLSTLDGVAKKLSDKAFDNLTSLDPEKMGVGLVQAGASALISAFTGDQKAKQELAKAQQAWHDMAGQVSAFNLAAKGVNLGPLTNELNSLYSTAETLMRAARDAHDRSGEDQAGAMFSGALNRILKEFRDGSQTLTPLQQQMKAVNDEAEGLAETLLMISPDLSGAASDIRNIAKQQINDVVAKFHDTFIEGLTSRLNAAKGQTYLNDAAALIKQHQQDLSDAVTLGNDPLLLAQINSVYQAEAQKIADGASLTGDALAEFSKLFPDLSGTIHQATVDITGSIKTINDYLNSLKIGDKSILSPQDQLGAAASSFSQQIALAQGGNTDALGSITQYASTYLDQAKSYYASSSGYTDIYRAVTQALSGLTGAQSYSSPLSTSPISSSVMDMPTAVMPPMVRSVSASNDNGQYFTQQTQTLVQAIASMGGAEIQALREEIATLRAQNERLIAAVSANRPRALRPTQKAS